MKKPEVFLKPIPRDIIELAKDHTRMASEIKHLLFLSIKIEEGEDYTWILNKSHLSSEVSYIAEQIRKVAKENKELKEKLSSLKD